MDDAHLEGSEVCSASALDGFFEGALVSLHLHEALHLLHIHFPGRPVRLLECLLVRDELCLVCLNLRIGESD